MEKGENTSSVPAVIATLPPDNVLSYIRLVEYEVSRLVESTVLIVEYGNSNKRIASFSNVEFVSTALCLVALIPDILPVILALAIALTLLTTLLIDMVLPLIVMKSPALSSVLKSVPIPTIALLLWVVVTVPLSEAWVGIILAVKFAKLELP